MPNEFYQYIKECYSLKYKEKPKYNKYKKMFYQLYQKSLKTTKNKRLQFLMLILN